MSHPRCGYVYELAVPGARATHAVVLTEDLWNAQLRDSIVVPIYNQPGANQSSLLVQIDGDLFANCTRVQSMDHEFIEQEVGACSHEPWLRTRIGVRRFLDIDRRIAKLPPVQPSAPRTGWFPRQNHVRFAVNPSIPAKDKLYGIISDDDWNALPSAPNVAAVRLTSKPKPTRLRWEVPVSGGFVVVGDIYSLAMSDIERKPPPAKYPARLTNDESAAIAVKQKASLLLS